MEPWCFCYLPQFEKKKYFSHFQWVHQSITNITEDSTNEKALYVTHEDICESFEGNTLLAIQAPNGTQLEVPIPEQSGLKKKYQIHLKSTDGQIYVLLGKNLLQIVRAHIYISNQPTNSLVWKLRSTILIFLLFFAEFVKSTAFPKSKHIWIAIFASNWNSNVSTLWNINNGVQK